MTHPTPQRGTESEVVGRRIGATLVDGVVVFAVLYAGIWAVGGSALARAVGLSPTVVLGFLLWFVFAVMTFAPLLVMHDYSPVWFVAGVGIWVGYGVACEALWGQTLGKRLFGIVVAGRDGARCSPRAAVVRNLLRAVDGLLGYGVGFLVLAMTERSQRLGDLLAGTVVVGAEDAWLSRMLREELPTDRETDPQAE